ncbi:MAG: tyrosine-protein phosphatase [Treponema sp.]|nr:tyrosine-protein phosphatase [Treponema sp.]
MGINNSDYGYKINGEEIEFFLLAESFPETVGFEQIFVSGSFNGWHVSADPAWKLTKKVEKKNTYFSLVKNISSVKVPGNSGFPEFNFILLAPTEVIYLKNEKEVENNFSGNRVILLNNFELEDFLQVKKNASYKKSLPDFDLNCPCCRAELANLRFVPQTSNLIRGYHPYKKSFSDSEIENERFKLIEKAFKLYGIKSLITLSGYELPSNFVGEIMPDFVQKIEENDNRLSLSLDYVLIYYHPEAAEFSNILRKISLFIINHPGPFYIHCRNGCDRTAVISAIFASLAGASWNDIAIDYEKSYEAAIDEYRNRNLLKYSFQKMLGYSVTDSKDLAHLMQSYFIKEKILTASEIKKLLEKLYSAPRKKETDYFNFTENHICAKRSAKI